MSPPRTQQIDSARARRIAVAADVDPRTVLREVRNPGSVRGMAGDRIRSVLQQENLAEQPSPQEDAR